MKLKDPSAPLRRYVRLLGEDLGRTLKAQLGEEFYRKVEIIRQLSKKAQTGDLNAADQLTALLGSLAPEDMLGVVRAFSHFLNLANIAENVYRIRRKRWHQLHHRESPQQGSIEATFKLFAAEKISPKELAQTVENLHIDLVLTAHPTEVLRRTLIQKFDRIAKYLSKLDGKEVTPQEQAELQAGLYREITSVWLTDEIRHRRPTPLDEAKWGLTVVEECLWYALPNVLKELDYHLHKITGQRLPLTATPIQFSSWMGGDRDGNPNVTADLSEKVCFMSRWLAVDLYWREINQLSASLSMNVCSEEMRREVGDASEPYRALLFTLKQRLIDTRRWLMECLKGKPTPVTEVIESKEQLLTPLLLCYRSLQASGASCIAEGELADLIRRVACFGIGLLRLDLRQEASKHTALLEEITQFLGKGSYSSWDESSRFKFLNDQLTQQASLIPKDFVWQQSEEVWKTFKMIARQLPASLGAYVVSMTKAPSDILAICLLQREAGVKHFLRVVPLFETLSDLQSAGDCLDSLLSCAWYKNHIQGHQEIMIGYSDSGKDAGILAAGWAQYRAQEECVQVAKRHAIRLTLFHGRGGTVGRGGQPAHMAILSQPPGSVAGRLRVTEQGEVIRNKYSIPARAYRSLELYTTATLEATLLPPPQPKATWREMMQQLATVSFNEYSRVVKNDSAFLEYFQQVTPLTEIGNLSIGSRPPRRDQLNGLEGLRAIPWVFSWTQNRLLLPAWLGVGEALQAAYTDNALPIIQEMAEGWPFFRSLLSMIEMVLTKADPTINAFYERRLVEARLQPIGKALRQQLAQTRNAIKRALNIEELLATNPVLFRTIHLRAPYLYPLHVLQAELLWRVRQLDRNRAIREKDQDALMVSISGIAAGMQNTG